MIKQVKIIVTRIRHENAEQGLNTDIQVNEDTHFGKEEFSSDKNAMPFGVESPAIQDDVSALQSFYEVDIIK